MNRTSFLIVIIIFLLSLVACNSQSSVQSNSSLTTEHTTAKEEVTQESGNTKQDSSNPGLSSEYSNNIQNESLDKENPTNNNESKMQEKLNKLKHLQELQKQKTFMFIIAQDDLETYTWGGESSFPGLWRQLYSKYGYNGELLISTLQYDLDTYLACGNSEYGLLWAKADLAYEQYKAGEMNMTEQQYERLNDVYHRLGILYAKREYASKFPAINADNFF